MKPGIMNLKKWAAKTSMQVEAICLKKQAPCVGFSLVFFDPMAPDEERWNFVIELAYDPHNPPAKEEQERLQKAFEFINEGVIRILGGAAEPGTDPEEYTREVSWQ